jgi:CubicO group peptidase (beta-lactamase class C family)
MSVMTAHLYIPAIDKTKNSAMSISEKSINGILRDEIGFKGLAFTDALNMQGVAKYHPSGELEVKALEAGNDILLGPVDIPKALEAIKAALESGRISKEYLQEKVRKVLAAKYWAGLHSFKPIQEYGLEQDLNSGYSTFLLNTLIEKQLCLVKNDKQILPIDVSDKLKIATVAIGERWENTFQRTISNYTDATHFVFQSSITTVQADQLKQDLRDYDLVIVGLHGTSKFPRNNYKVTGTASSLVKELNARFNCVFVDFGNPYNLIYFQNLSTVLMGYEDQDVHQMKAAQALFGAVDLDAKLSVSVGRSYPLYSGEYIKHLNIMQFGAPEEVNMRSESLKRIDKIVEKAIEAKATPGCQVLVARYGKVVYQKSYGYHTYTRETAVKNSDLYDIASLTKIMATTLAVMKLVEEKVIKLDDKLSKYLGVLDTTNKKDVTIRQVLTHSSGLKDWIPFYRPTVSSPLAYDTIYHNTEDDKFCVKVDDDLYMCKDYQGVIFGQIYSSEVAGKGDYRYSDLGMILMKYLIEKATHTTFDRYMDSVFYEPMGLKHTAFNPLRRFSKDVIVPTEENSDFRKGLIHGYVHDPAAAMLGGVSGHAGLFANSMDLAVVMQMLLNGGTYNGYRFLTPKTITQFTGYQNKDSRRGLGFDKPEPNSRKVNPVSDYASKLTFGHSGFTGTQIWADPQYGLVYVFLSNRVHPSADNKLLVRMGVRTEVMNVIYESMNHEKLME